MLDGYKYQRNHSRSPAALNNKSKTFYEEAAAVGAQASWRVAGRKPLSINICLFAPAYFQGASRITDLRQQRT